MCITNSGLEALCTSGELAEARAIGKRPTVKLQRTFNQTTYDADLKPSGYIKFWRVVGPETHSNYGSDLSRAGLIEWGII